MAKLKLDRRLGRRRFGWTGRLGLDKSDQLGEKLALVPSCCIRTNLVRHLGFRSATVSIFEGCHVAVGVRPCTRTIRCTIFPFPRIESDSRIGQDSRRKTGCPHAHKSAEVLLSRRILPTAAIAPRDY